MSNVPGVSCTNHWEVIEGLEHCSRCTLPFCRDCLVTMGGARYCAHCKDEQMRDVVSGVSGLQLASRGRRFAALWIDGFVTGIPLWTVLLSIYGLSLFSRMSRGVVPPGMRYLSYTAGVVFFVYESLMLASRGQTLGKMAMRIKVVRADGSDISTGQAWGRSAVRAILLSVLAIVNYLPSLLTKEKTCVHDLAAKTRVVNWS